MCLHIIDLAVSSLPFFLGAESLDPLNHYSAIPGPVKNRNMSVFRHSLPESPEIVMAFLCRSRRSRRAYQIASWIHRFCKTFDGASFSSCVPSLKPQYHRDPLAVQLAVEDFHTILELFQLFFIFFLSIGQRQIHFAQYGRIQILIFLWTPYCFLLLCCFSLFFQSQFFPSGRYFF